MTKAQGYMLIGAILYVVASIADSWVSAFFYTTGTLFFIGAIDKDEE